MSNVPQLSYAINEQLKQIEQFAKQREHDVAELIGESQSHFSDTVLNSGTQVQSHVSDMLSDIETQIENEMDKINQQLQSLLPSSNQ